MTPNSPECNWHDFSWGFLLQRQLVKDSSASLSPSRRGSQKSIRGEVDKNIGYPPGNLSYLSIGKRNRASSKVPVGGDILVLREGTWSHTFQNTFGYFWKKHFFWRKFVSTRLRIDSFFFPTFFGSSCHGWRPFATSFPWHPFGLVSSVMRSLGEEGSIDVPHGCDAPHLKGRTFTSAGVGGSEGPGWKLWSCDVFVFGDVRCENSTPKTGAELELAADSESGGGT